MQQPTEESRPSERKPRAKPQGEVAGKSGFSGYSGDAPGGDLPGRRDPPDRMGRRDADDPDGMGGERMRRYTQISERNRCRFCREKITRVDYKDVLTLQKLSTNQGRIFSRKRSGNCAAHQRMVKKAIKQARFIGLLNYTA